MPVHGTLHHLRRHAELAKKWGVPDVQVVENGTAVVFDGRTLSVEGPVPAGRVAVGFRGVELSPKILSQRVELARTGVATVALALDVESRLVGTPSIRTFGIAGVDEAVLRSTAMAVVRAVDALGRRPLAMDRLEQEVRRVVRRALFEVGGTKPVVEVHVLGRDD